MIQVIHQSTGDQWHIYALESKLHDGFMHDVIYSSAHRGPTQTIMAGIIPDYLYRNTMSVDGVGSYSAYVSEDMFILFLSTSERRNE